MRNLEIACNKFSAKSRYVGTYAQKRPLRSILIS